MSQFFQEHRAERALEALRHMAAPTARVLRDGSELTVRAREVVTGDILTLRAGDRVSADGRLLVAADLGVDESALTGESVAVGKSTEPKEGHDIPIGDRLNMVYAGTLIARGRGEAVVVATGMSTEFGRISDLVQTLRSGRTPLQESLDRLGRVLGKGALAIVALIVVAGLLSGQGAADMLMFGIALAVAVVPEALPAVVTISLAIGVRRMVVRRALVRRLAVVETLGSTSVICSDKTGTLTRNEMTVRRIWTADGVIEVSGVGYEPVGAFTRHGTGKRLPDAAIAVLETCVLASDARLGSEGGRWKVEGDPTEGALIVCAMKAGIDALSLRQTHRRSAEVGFTSERRRMTAICNGDDGPVAHSKGAVDVVLRGCTAWLRAGDTAPLGPDDREAVLEVEREMASSGLRVLALARRAVVDADDPESRMTLLGLVGMMDPPREEAKEAIATSWRAGITPVMITGDHPLTATAIAAEIELLRGRRVMAGDELAGLSDDRLAREVARVGVYARVSPADKMRIVSAWQSGGAIVAMTGDGINDAPALKKADVGIAMGVSGTDVSKEAAAITLLDDNYATIVAAIEEGRIIFGNIRKYLTYLLSSNVGEILLMATAVSAGMPLPLTAVQILYVNLATDGLPALALAIDPPETDLMSRAPRDPRASMFPRPVVTLVLAGGAWSAMVNLTLFGWLLHIGRPLAEAMCMTFVSLVMVQLLKAYNYRSDRSSVFYHTFANRWLNLAVAWELALLAVIVHTPWLQEPFGTFSLGLGDWVLAVASASTIVPVLEAVKWLERRKPYAPRLVLPD